MCGIAGELRLDGTAASPEAVRAMTDAMMHRGPDDEGSFCDGPIGLGHRRLSIIDLSPGGHQPMATPSGRYTIVFNGEIYNYQELRAQLGHAGRAFRSDSDSEVLLAAIEVWGLEAALNRVIGMFAFGLWDRDEQVLTICRDRVGIKPMHYHRGRACVLFASELKGLVAHPLFERETRPAAVAQFLSIGYIVAPATIYERTFKLLPGHYARITAGGELTQHRYWSLDEVQRGSFSGSLEDAAAELERIAIDAFRYRLVSDVPVGVFLSGGTDSSYLAAILRHRIGADLLHLTIGFRGSPFDESAQAAMVAKVLGVRHEVRHLDAAEALQMLERFVDIYDEPFSDTSGLPTLLVSQVAREYVKVVLSADGGDEQFCGYPSYAEYAARYDLLRRVPLLARRGLHAVLGALPLSRAASWGAGRDAGSTTPQVVARYEKALALLPAASVNDVMKLMNEKAWPPAAVPSLVANHQRHDPYANTPVDHLHGDLRGAALVDAMMRTDYAMFLPDDVLTKVDRASMAVSLECRDPFLDHRLAEFAYSLPLEYLSAGGEQKRILKHALRQWLPEAIVTAPKRGFMIPLYDWLRGPWRPLVDRYLSTESIRRVGLLDERAAARAVGDFYAVPGRRAERIMALLLLQMWGERQLG